MDWMVRVILKARAPEHCLEMHLSHNYKYSGKVTGKVTGKVNDVFRRYICNCGAEVRTYGTDYINFNTKCIHEAQIMESVLK